MRRGKKSLALVLVLAFCLTMILPGVGLAQGFSALPMPKAPTSSGYDAAKQADAMVKSHDTTPKLNNQLIEKIKSSSEGEFIPVIIKLKDKADLKKLKANFNKQNYSENALKQHKAAVIDALKNHAQKSQTGVLKTLEEQKNKGKAKNIKSFWIFNGITAHLDKAAIYELARNPMVEEIIYNDIKFTAVTQKEVNTLETVKSTVYDENDTTTPDENDITAPDEDNTTTPDKNNATVIENTYQPALTPQTSVTWGISKIGADQVWSMGYDGTGVTVGVLDTGVDPRNFDLLIDPNGDPNDLNNWKLVNWAQFDYYGNIISNDRQYAYDDDGHGTHVSGTSLGNSYSGVSIGVAPGARLVVGKVLDYGSGSFEQVAAGMEWIVTVPDVRVVNMSLGATGTWDVMIEPTRNMMEMFVFPAFAIGNSGPGSTGSPGNVPAAFGVGATDEYDNIAYFSSGGWVEWNNDPYHGEYLKPDVSAPGVSVYSCLPGNGYDYWSGTSMATPHVTGSVALILQVCPWLSVEEVKSVLKHGAVDLGAGGPDPYHGWGRINVKNSIDLLYSGEYGIVSGAITGPDAEAVEADVLVDGNWLSKADPVYGSYDLVLPRGSHELKVSHPLYKDASVTVNIANGEVIDQNFNLSRKVQGSIGGTVTNASGELIANAVVELEGVMGAATKTDSKGRYRLDNIPEGSYKLRLTPPLPYGFQRTDVTIPASGGLVMKDFNVNTADILLVDHDYWNSWEKYFMEALIQKGYSFAYWDWNAALEYAWYPEDCLPPLDIMKLFNKVILSDFDGSIIYVDEELGSNRCLRQYLDSGRKMFVSGEDIGWAVGYIDFYRNYLHATYLADYGSLLVRGLPAGAWPQGILKGLDMDISFNSGGDGANNQWYPDVVAPADSQAVSVADYVDSYVAGSGALAVDGPLHRLMYFSFGFEGINGADTRADVMDRVMKYLDSPTENTSPAISYSTAWNTVSDSNATDGRYRVSSTTNATSVYQFTGDNVTWVTAKGPAYGKAEVFIDGTSKGVVDLYNSTQAWNQRLTYTGLGSGSHVITIKVLGQKNTSSTGTAVVVDSFAFNYDERDPSVVYSGSWTQASNSNAYNGTVSYSDQKNASATFTFTGQGVTLLVGKGPYRGIAQIYLDGVNKGTVDLYAPNYSYNVPVKTFTGLPSTKHTLKIVVTGTKNPSATGIRIMTDAFSVYTEDNSQDITYSNAWTLAASSSASGGSFHYSDATNAKATYKFAGNSITLLISKGPNRGIGRIYIDGVDKGTVDFYNSSYLYKVPVTFSGLFFGEHTVELVNTGTKNSASSSTRITLDAFNRGLND